MFFAINRRRWLFQSGQPRLRRAAFIGMFFAINRRRWLFQSAETRLRHAAFIGLFFAINRRRWLFQSGQTRLRHAAFIGIFFAINRRNMRWILVEIRPADPKFFFVRVDPLPQDSLHVHLSSRVSPFTLTRSAASPWP